VCVYIKKKYFYTLNQKKRRQECKSNFNHLVLGKNFKLAELKKYTRNLSCKDDTRYKIKRYFSDLLRFLINIFKKRTAIRKLTQSV
jgi:hypothetical protein